MRQVRQMQARSRSTSWGPRLWAAAAAIAALVMLPQQAPAAAGAAGAATAAKPVAGYSGLTSEQRANLLRIARDTWKFYGVDIDPATQLPMDNLTFAGGSATPTGYGRYTSAANIGVYLWAVVAVGHRDLVLDQSMIMAALDNALENRAIQRDFARDPVSWAARTYLSVETMSLR
jgi:hypothetical protein